MTPQLLLSGQAAVVTGATGGVARGIAVELAHSGATVYLTGRSHAKLDDVVAEIAAAAAVIHPDANASEPTSPTVTSTTRSRRSSTMFPEASFRRSRGLRGPCGEVPGVVIQRRERKP
jgi:NAD(P)-dependent dehydrogenase (short-subunit alcohol dehydrogenase family)